MGFISNQTLSSTDLRFNIEDPEGESQELALKGANDIASEYRSFLDERLVLKGALAGLRNEASKSVADMVGPTKWSDLLARWHRERTANLGTPIQLPARNVHEWNESARRDLRRESILMLRDLGIDQEDLKR